MSNKKTLVLGASENIARYSNMAIKRLRSHGHDVVAIGKRDGVVGDVEIHKSKPEEKEIDTVTVYMNEHNQKDYEDYILSLKPKRVIFNPGAENSTFAKRAAKHNIEPIEACTLVMLSTGQF